MHFMAAIVPLTRQAPGTDMRGMAGLWRRGQTAIPCESDATMVHSPATTSIRTRVLTGAGLVLLGVVLAFGVSELWWTAALSQEKFAADGIPNFGVIDEHV